MLNPYFSLSKVLLSLAMSLAYGLGCGGDKVTAMIKRPDAGCGWTFLMPLLAGFTHWMKTGKCHFRFAHIMIFVPGAACISKAAPPGSASEYFQRSSFFRAEENSRAASWNLPATMWRCWSHLTMVQNVIFAIVPPKTRARWKDETPWEPIGNTASNGK